MGIDALYHQRINEISGEENMSYCFSLTAPVTQFCPRCTSPLLCFDSAVSHPLTVQREHFSFVDRQHRVCTHTHTHTHTHTLMVDDHTNLSNRRLLTAAAMSVKDTVHWSVARTTNFLSAYSDTRTHTLTLSYFTFFLLC